MKIGVVTGLIQSTPYEFYVRLFLKESKDPSQMVQIEDIVKVHFSYGSYGELVYYGIVSEIVTRWDGELSGGYEEDVVLKGIKPVLPIYIAKVLTTRTMTVEDGELVEGAPEVPPPAGTTVELVEGDEVNVALGFDELRKKETALPVGVLKNGKPAYVDVRYILGDNGAHINVSGQSGVAAKTSYTTFLIKSMIDSAKKGNSHLMNLLKRARYIVFNVKGESLMFIDRWNKEWKENEGERTKLEWEKMYKGMGIDPSPFKNVWFYAPRKEPTSREPHINKRMDGKVKSYGWDVFDIVDLNLLELMFDPDEMEKNPNLQLAVGAIQEFLQNRLEELIGYYKGIDRGKNMVEKAREMVKAKGDGFVKNFLPLSLGELIDSMKDDESDLRKFLKSEDVQRQTIGLVIRRLKNAQKQGFDCLWVQPDIFDEKPSYSISWNRPGGVTVIDISKLKPRAQAFVVGAILSDVMWEKEEKMFEDPVFIFLDELNKYAPRHGGGALGSIFRDVSERGRSFRVILIGAEQTASEVDYRVITQAATVIVGRQKGAELMKPEYFHLTESQRRKASILRQGEVIVDQPFLRTPLTVRFPLPAWCTREDGWWEETKESILKDVFM